MPFVAAVRVNDDDLDSNPGWILWEEDMRLLLDTSRLDRPSLGSPEELGLLLEMRALFEVLPFREVRPLSESGCTSLDEGTPSEVRFLEWSLCKPEPKAFLRGNVSTAPENLSRISCPEVLSSLSTDGPAFKPALPVECRPLELAPI